MVKFKDFSRPLSIFKYFSQQILFLRTFQDSPVYSSTFQACANPVCGLGDAKDWKLVFCQARNLRYKFDQNGMKSIYTKVKDINEALEMLAFFHECHNIEYSIWFINSKMLPKILHQ